MTDEQYYRALYNASKKQDTDAVKQKFISWIYANCQIGNGKMLVERMEDMQTQEAYRKQFGIDDDVELV